MRNDCFDCRFVFFPAGTFDSLTTHTEFSMKSTEQDNATERYAPRVSAGGNRMVQARVVLPAEARLVGLPMLDALRAETLTRLKELHPATTVDMAFTADPMWGAPTGQGDATTAALERKQR